MTESMAPLVLSGPPRSGTTLFAALLDGHPDINWLLDEGFFFEHLDRLGAANHALFLRAAALGTASLVEGLRDRSLMPPTHVPPSDFPSLAFAWSEERFRAALGRPPAASVRALWQMLRDAYLAGFGYAPRRYVFIKAADYGRSVFGALDHFAEARGIVVVREPVAALNSLKAYRRRRGAKLLTWPTLVEAVAAMNELAARVGRAEAKRLRVYRYEDFAEQPAGAMRALCTWLGLAFEPTLTEPTMMGRPWSNNSSFVAGEPGLGDEPEQRPAALTPEERDYVLWATEPFRTRFGYAEVDISAERHRATTPASGSSPAPPHATTPLQPSL